MKTCLWAVQKWTCGRVFSESRERVLPVEVWKLTHQAGLSPAGLRKERPQQTSGFPIFLGASVVTLIAVNALPRSLDPMKKNSLLL